MIPIKQVSKIINAPTGRIWAVIASWGSEKFWFPGVRASSLEGFGVGAIRSMTFAEGNMSVRERLDVADPTNHIIEYTILSDDHRMKNPRARLSLEEVNGGLQTRFTWAGYSDSVHPEFKPTLEAMLENMYKGAMDSVARVTEEGK
ncbi:hypothetical protein G7054_g10449 [Neopestalotiopsis clavispora]|nr:hypothetical protein G7054_g10449 [Neopestalotiopsis clavispora]